MENSPIPLSQLKVGEQGIITNIRTNGAARQRLLAMGMVRGETVQVERVAPLGDPIDLLIKNYHLSLRKLEASEILVRKVSPWNE